jgi:hypothetical protein
MKLFVWFRKLFRRDVGQGTLVRLPFTHEEAELLRWWAQRNEVSIETLIVRSALKAIPAKHRMAFHNRLLVGNAIEKALDSLDEEPMSYEGVFPLLDAVVEQTTLPVETTDHVVDTSIAHPCFWIKRGISGDTLLKEGDAHGTCCEPSQRGKPCHWAGPLAPQCPVYRPRIALRKKS